MSSETNKHGQVFGGGPSGKGRSRFEDSPIVGFAFKHMLHLLDSPVRRRFNDPVKTLEAAGV
jgi:hypothetical protein